MHPKIEELVDAMTLEEQVSLLSGEDFWSLPAVSRLGIGKLRVTDGPNGARGGGSLIGGVRSAAFPVGIAIGATWNVSLAREIGAALADEVKSKGAHVSLAPTVNIQRSVTNGRNFECYSEDPVLTAGIAVGYIRGLQENGIAATIKHFVGNESEIERTTMSSEIDERTLREVYLAPFEAAVKEAGTWAVMSSYNRLNGTFTSENAWLLDTVLRREWHFTGVVMSDWFGSHSTAPTVLAGLDLEMPGPPRDRGDKLVAAVNAGEVPRHVVRERVLNVLRLMDRTHALKDMRSPLERAEDRPAHREIIRRAGAEGAVLLVNRDGVLPLDGEALHSVAAIGPNAKTAQIMGGGSAQLNPHYAMSPWEGLVAALGAGRVRYAEGCTNHRWEPVLRGHFDVEYFNSSDLGGPVVDRGSQQDAEGFLIGHLGSGKVDPAKWSARFTGSYTAQHSGTHRVGAFAAGHVRVRIDGRLVTDAWSHWTPGRTFFEEGCDEVVGTVDLERGRTYRVEIEFASRPPRVLAFSAFRVGIGFPLGDAAIEDAVAAARAAETAIVFVGRNGEWDTEGSDLTDIRLPGRQDELVAAVAKANPRTIVVLQTGGPVEMPWLDDVAAVVQFWYPGQEAGNAVADVLLGRAEPGGRLAQTFPRRWADNPTHSQDRQIYPGLDGKVRYEEGVFVGYRHYERTGTVPLFPFGFGLSYTEFALFDLAVDASRFEADGLVTVSVTVANEGARAGSTVVQVYVGDDEASVERPRRELKGFAKVHLDAGDWRRVDIALTARAFAFYGVKAAHWKVEAGSFTIAVGQSSADTPLTATVARETTLLLPV